jgi:hypothetical protein
MRWLAAAAESRRLRAAAEMLFSSTALTKTVISLSTVRPRFPLRGRLPPTLRLMGKG